MKRFEDKNWLDKALTEAIGAEDKKPDFEKWKEKHPQAVEMLTSRAGKETTASPPNIRKIIMKSPITKLAAAAVIIITGLVCVQFLAGTSAYAQVVAELRNARTVVFTLITQTNQGNGETIKTDVVYKEPGRLRTTTIDGYVAIVDATIGKMISIVPQGGYTLGEINNTGTTGAQGPLASIEAMKSLPAKADENLCAKEIDGNICDGYKVMQGDLATTVWLDASLEVPETEANAHVVDLRSRGGPRSAALYGLMVLARETGVIPPEALVRVVRESPIGDQVPAEVLE